MGGQQRHVLVRYRDFFRAAVTLALLMPVPAYAALVWTTSWTVDPTAPVPVNVVNGAAGFGPVSGNPDQLYINPTKTNTTTSITLMRSFTADQSKTFTANAILSNLRVSNVSGNNVSIRVWTTSAQNGVQNTISAGAFNNNPLVVPGAGLGTPMPNQTGTSAFTLFQTNPHVVRVQFQINSTNWNAAASPAVVFAFQQP